MIDYDRVTCCALFRVIAFFLSKLHRHTAQVSDFSMSLLIWVGGG